MINIEQADAFFAVHLAREFWSGLNIESKNAALTMARSDIDAELLHPVDETDNYHTAAVFEQALWLAQHFSELNRCQRVVSENIEGVGGAAYAVQNSILAPRAKLLLQLNAPVCIRFGRG
jgi:hypothetical protein